MKKIYTSLLVIALLTVIYACGKNSVTPTVLTGKWVQSSNYISNGGGGNWTPITNSTYVQFNANGTLSGTSFPGFVNYTLKDTLSITIIKLTKSDKTTQGYQYTLHDGFLDLSPFPVICIEGCASRFTKQSD